LVGAAVAEAEVHEKEVPMAEQSRLQSAPHGQEKRGSGGARVLRAAELPTINRAKGVITQPLVMAERGSASLTMGISTFQPGVVIPLHTHNVEEAITILEGEAVAIIDGRE